jgi:hypothetical protein
LTKITAALLSGKVLETGSTMVGFGIEKVHVQAIAFVKSGQKTARISMKE